MPKAQSDTQPSNFVESRGKTQANFNIEQIEITDEQGPHQIWQCDYVEIEGTVTKAKLLAAMDTEERENDGTEWTPNETAVQHKDAKDAIVLSEVTGITYAKLDTYIDNNIIDLASAKSYLKKLSKIVLAHIKLDDLD